MSWQPAIDPKPGDSSGCEAIATVIVPRSRDLGGFSVRRALPSAERQMVGPFIFFDQMGPAEFLLGSGMDVRPHPHIVFPRSLIYSTERSSTAIPLAPCCRYALES
jgi:hypothetical protein